MPEKEEPVSPVQDGASSALTTLPRSAYDAQLMTIHDLTEQARLAQRGGFFSALEHLIKSLVGSNISDRQAQVIENQMSQHARLVERGTRTVNLIEQAAEAKHQHEMNTLRRAMEIEEMRRRHNGYMSGIPEPVPELQPVAVMPNTPLVSRTFDEKMIKREATQALMTMGPEGFGNEGWVTYRERLVVRHGEGPTQEIEREMFRNYSQVK